ncbi:hypothetical protein DFJ73DRAFT_819051 [Zopfochytrium polystomum]|nr:hypothetical protein DFJ73DRAFT_819051 [Zopfochytrium polystomum]
MPPPLPHRLVEGAAPPSRVLHSVARAEDSVLDDGQSSLVSSPGGHHPASRRRVPTLPLLDDVVLLGHRPREPTAVVPSHIHGPPENEIQLQFSTNEAPSVGLSDGTSVDNYSPRINNAINSPTAVQEISFSAPAAIQPRTRAGIPLNGIRHADRRRRQMSQNTIASALATWEAAESAALRELEPVRDLLTNGFLPCSFVFEGKLSPDGFPVFGDVREVQRRTHNAGQEHVVLWENSVETVARRQRRRNVSLGSTTERSGSTNNESNEPSNDTSENEVWARGQQYEYSVTLEHDRTRDERNDNSSQYRSSPTMRAESPSIAAPSQLEIARARRLFNILNSSASSGPAAVRLSEQSLDESDDAQSTASSHHTVTSMALTNFNYAASSSSSSTSSVPISLVSRMATSIPSSAARMIAARRRSGGNAQALLPDDISDVFGRWPNNGAEDSSLPAGAAANFSGTTYLSRYETSTSVEEFMSANQQPDPPEPELALVPTTLWEGRIQASESIDERDDGFSVIAPTTIGDSAESSIDSNLDNFLADLAQEESATESLLHPLEATPLLGQSNELMLRSIIAVSTGNEILRGDSPERRSRSASISDSGPRPSRRGSLTYYSPRLSRRSSIRRSSRSTPIFAADLPFRTRDDSQSIDEDIFRRSPFEQDERGTIFGRSRRLQPTGTSVNHSQSAPDILPRWHSRQPRRNGSADGVRHSGDSFAPSSLRREIRGEINISPVLNVNDNDSVHRTERVPSEQTNSISERGSELYVSRLLEPPPIDGSPSFQTQLNRRRNPLSQPASNLPSDDFALLAGRSVEHASGWAGDAETGGMEGGSDGEDEDRSYSLSNDYDDREEPSYDENGHSLIAGAEQYGDDELSAAILRCTRQARVRRVLLQRHEGRDSAGILGLTAEPFRPEFSLLRGSSQLAGVVEIDEVPLTEWLMTRDLLDFDGDAWVPNGENTCMPVSTTNRGTNQSRHWRSRQRRHTHHPVFMFRRVTDTETDTFVSDTDSDGSSGDCEVVPRELVSPSHRSARTRSTGDGARQVLPSPPFGTATASMAAAAFNSPDQFASLPHFVSSRSTAWSPLLSPGSADFWTLSSRRAPCGWDVPGGGFDLLQRGLDADGNWNVGENGEGDFSEILVFEQVADGNVTGRVREAKTEVLMVVSAEAHACCGR